MVSAKSKNGWHGRGLTSLLTLAGFMIMGLTGLVLYFVPHGRIAYWTHWTFLGLDKTQWGDIHILASVLFVIVGIIHTVYNWGRLWGYLKDKVHGGVKLKKELLVAGVVSVLLVVSGIAHLPPLSYLLDLNATIKDAWVADKDHEPPFGHAELLTLRVFCSKVGIPYEPARAELEAKGVTGLGPKKTLDEIARANGSSPLELYKLIKHLEKPLIMASPKGWPDAEAVQQAFAGTGIGKKSIEDIAKQVGLPASELFARLKAKGFAVEPGEALKTASGRLGQPPLKLLEAALVEPPAE